MAPFRAVPSPQPRDEEIASEEELRSTPPAPAPRARRPRPAAQPPAAPPPAAPSPAGQSPVRRPAPRPEPARAPAADRSRPEEDRSTGRAVSGPVPPPERQGAAGRPGAGRPRSSGPSAPPYGDWTRPSSSGEQVSASPGADEEFGTGSQRFARLRASANAQDAIRAEGGARISEPVTGPTTGGRAALRAERQAAESARKRAGRGGATAVDAGRGAAARSRLLSRSLVAVAVLALGLLGFYSFTSPLTRVTAASTPALPSAADPGSPASSAGMNLPPLAAGGVSAAPASGAPVRVPVTVLNSTAVRGLAADVAAAIKSGGWATNPVGAYSGRDVSASTVYFTQNDEAQRQAATQLVAQFPQLHGPVARFFEVPNSPSPGLVVVVTGDWRP